MRPIGAQLSTRAAVAALGVNLVCADAGTAMVKDVISSSASGNFFIDFAHKSKFPALNRIAPAKSISRRALNAEYLAETGG